MLTLLGSVIHVKSAQTQGEHAEFWLGQATETNGRDGQRHSLRASRHIVQIQQWASWTAMSEETGKPVLCQEDRSGMSVHTGKGLRHVSMPVKCENRLLWTCHKMYQRAIKCYAKVISPRSRQIPIGVLALPLTNLWNLSNNNLSKSPEKMASYTKTHSSKPHKLYPQLKFLLPGCKTVTPLDMKQSVLGESQRKEGQWPWPM